jgi:hypothetical protein
MLTTLDLWCEENVARRKWNWPRHFAQAALLNLQKIGQFPDEPEVVENGFFFPPRIRDLFLRRCP